MSVPQVKLRPHHERRVRDGHPWVFSNEIDGDVARLPPGGAVEVVDAKGRLLGRGTANPTSLIAVRLMSRRRDDLDHPAFWAQKLREAASLRASVMPERRSGRLVHAEGDGIPGLIVDRHGDWLAVQLGTLGTEVRKELIGQALREVFAPAGAVLRSEGRNRQLEGLPDESAVWWGDAPEHVVVDEWGVKFQVPLLDGQKTGHFYDQAWNRHFAAPLCKGRTVADVYANGGGWGLHALAAGAKSVVAVDKSAACAEQMAVNAALNGVSDRFTPVAAEGKAWLQQQAARAARFGAVVLDPPAFAKARSAAGPALRGYREINAIGASLVEPGGFLFTSSCSYHVQEDRFLDAVREGAREAGRHLRMIRRGEQGPDHPVDPAVPETRYLKSFAFEVQMA